MSGQTLGTSQQLCHFEGVPHDFEKRGLSLYAYPDANHGAGV